MLSRKEYVDNLKRIYVASRFYAEASEDDKGRIYVACEGLFDKIVGEYATVITDDNVIASTDDSRLDRSFGILLLLFGGEFLLRQFECETFDDFVDKFIE